MVIFIKFYIFDFGSWSVLNCISYVMQKLPQFPLPTHDVIVRGVIPLEFEVCVLFL